MFPFPRVRALLAVVSFVASFSPLPALAEQAPGVMEKINEARTAYFKAVEPFEKAYREKLAEILQEADKVEVYLLDFEMKDAAFLLKFGWDESLMESTYFPIMPYGSKSKILKRRVLAEEERKRLLPELKRTLLPKPGEENAGAFCHYPIHGVRMWSQERMIFQTSFCWKCQNFYYEGPSGPAGWFGVGNAKLEPLMKELMPIPASEEARFEETMRPKPKATPPVKKKGK